MTAHLLFPATDDEAQSRADTYEKSDPFPSIEPTLLSSADIYDYVRVTGLIYRFYEDRLKSASYEACPGGEFQYWDENKKLLITTINDDIPFVRLPPNSISFIQLNSVFRLPYYIGARFNLSIRHVHRGLLLGTGPLVDPGFRGNLLIPLHNLTAEAYDLSLSESLIAIEFTKLRYGAKRNLEELPKEQVEKDFPKDKRFRTARQYLDRASGGWPIIGVMPDVVREMRKTVRSTRRWSIGLFIAVAAVIFASVWAGYEVVESSLTLSTAAQNSAADQQKDLGKLGQDLDALKREVAALKETLNKSPQPSPRPPAKPSATKPQH